MNDLATGQPVCLHTQGEFATEPEAVADLDDRLARSGLFSIHREIGGELIQPRLSTVDKSMRIDRLLQPTSKLLGKGWRYGWVGIEAKKSGKKLGPLILQALDYSRTVWKLPGTGTRLMVEWVMMWPCGAVIGDLESIMTQNRIGKAYADPVNALIFNVGGTNMLRSSADGEIVSVGNMRAGTKAGSR